MRTSIVAVCVVWAASVLGGCCTGQGGIDPYEKSNRAIYQFNDCLDRAVLKPMSEGYVKVTCAPVREGIGNAFGNLAGINSILNDFLQGKCQRGFSGLGRFATNTTVGLLGVFDVAKGWGMPAHDNDFGLTLGVWGADSGPYVVLPLLGPSSGRDVAAVPVAVVSNPLFWVDWPWEVSAGLTTLNVVDKRARLEPDLKLREQAALDPYVFTRDAYLQHRRARLAKETGKPLVEEGLYDDDAPTTRPTTRPTTEPAR